MALLELPLQLISAILIGYLTLTNTLAGGIEHIFGMNTNKPVVTENLPSQPTSTGSAEQIRETPSNYEFGGPIPRILIENTEYQKAAVLGNGTNTPQNANFSTNPYVRTTQALVNIYCQYRTDEIVRTTTGTGFFINQNGAILTNAHVAQFLLLDDAVPSIQDAGCVLRTGDPAEATYTADLLYISPAWVNENADLIMEERPRGTGERDYAILYVSGSVTNDPLPASFPYVDVDTALLSRHTEGIAVITGGYPAEIFYTDGAGAALRPVVANTTVGELYTFGSNYADIFSISSSKVGEHGTSGGPVAKEDGGIIGLVVTKGDTENEGEQSLRALTLSYIDRTIREETGFSLADNIRGDLAFRSNVFKKALAPFLTRILSFQFEE